MPLMSVAAAAAVVPEAAAVGEPFASPPGRVALEAIVWSVNSESINNCTPLTSTSRSATSVPGGAMRNSSSVTAMMPAVLAGCSTSVPKPPAFTTFGTPSPIHAKPADVVSIGMLTDNIGTRRRPSFPISDAARTNVIKPSASGRTDASGPAHAESADVPTATAALVTKSKLAALGNWSPKFRSAYQSGSGLSANCAWSPARRAKSRLRTCAS
jgi:hypothetical protein